MINKSMNKFKECDKMRIEEIENIEFREYVKDYVDRVIKAFDNKLEFVAFSQTLTDYTEHHIFEFALIGEQEIIFTKEQIAILTEDDDSQPHNQYRVYLDSLYIYSTRYQ